MAKKTVEEAEVRPLKSGLAFIVDAQLAVEKLRVATQVRQSHLKRQERQDENTDKVLAKLVEVEGFIDDIVASDITAHPAYPWFSRVKGIGRQNIGKVVGLIDITRAPMISSLWKFAGFHVVNGHSPKREKGQKLEAAHEPGVYQIGGVGDALIHVSIGDERPRYDYFKRTNRGRAARTTNRNNTFGKYRTSHAFPF